MWSAVMASSEQQWMVQVWILFFFLIHQAPQNVTIVSFNLEHKLIWTPGLRTPIFARFSVQRYHNRKKLWVSVLNCSDLSADEACDLTTSFKNSYYYYLARVQAFSPDQESNWTTSKRFHPIMDTTLGPPVVELRGCGNCLLLQLSPPASRGHHRQLESFFRDYIVNVSRTRDKAQFVIRASSGENLINYLEPGVEYCITVFPVTNMNNPVIPAGPHCSYTSPSAVNTVTMFVAALCTLILVVLFCTVLIYSCQLGVLHKLLPRTLHLGSLPAVTIPGNLSVASAQTPMLHDSNNHNSTLQALF